MKTISLNEAITEHARRLTAVDPTDPCSVEQLSKMLIMSQTRINLKSVVLVFDHGKEHYTRSSRTGKLVLRTKWT